MRKVIAILAVGAFLASGLSSCKKCSTCTATKAGSTDYVGPETCGKSSAIKDYEDAFKATWGAAGYSVVCE
jgi:cytochrome c2